LTIIVKKVARMICFFILQVYVLGEGIMISFITCVVSVYNDLFCV
jgi:hypothetical protein